MRLEDIIPDIRQKAGFIPYVIEDGEPCFMFMISSNSKFGGNQPSIAKGGIDKGETSLEAAFREAKEELGLRRRNIKDDTVKQVFTGKIKGKTHTYIMDVFMGEIKSKTDFGKFDHETAEVKWLTLSEFQKTGRPSHIGIVRKAKKLINADVAQ